MDYLSHGLSHLLYNINTPPLPCNKIPLGHAASSLMLFQKL